MHISAQAVSHLGELNEPSTPSGSYLICAVVDDQALTASEQTLPPPLLLGKWSPRRVYIPREHLGFRQGRSV